MKDPLLDEDGRCVRTDFLPDECGCVAHRGGRTPEEEADDVDYRLYLIDRFRIAKFSTRCKLVPAHQIEAGDDIGLAVLEEDISKPIGWVCPACVEGITYP